jgi:hypothetical protein
MMNNDRASSNVEMAARLLGGFVPTASRVKATGGVVPTVLMSRI